MVFGLIAGALGVGSLLGGSKKSKNIATADAVNNNYIDVTSAPNINNINQIDLSALAAAQRDGDTKLAKAFAASAALQARSSANVLTAAKDAGESIKTGAIIVGIGAATLAGVYVLSKS